MTVDEQPPRPLEPADLACALPEGRGPLVWQRRVRRPAPTRAESRRARRAAFRRQVRIVGLLLALTGCAIEPPRPDTAHLTPPGTPVLLPPPIISRFGDWGGHGGGPRLWQHFGIDIRAAVGTPVLAAADGVVVRIGEQALAGRLIVVSHAGDLSTVYYHLSRIGVVEGQTVRRGAVIGKAGVSGNATAPHLHFGVCRREGGNCGERITAGWDDPMKYWVAATPSGTPCFVSNLALEPLPVRLTYPVTCA